MKSSSSVPASHHKHPRQEFLTMSDSCPLGGAHLSELDASAPDSKDENYTSAPNQPPDSPREPESGSPPAARWYHRLLPFDMNKRVSSCIEFVSKSCVIHYGLIPARHLPPMGSTLNVLKVAPSTGLLA